MSTTGDEAASRRRRKLAMEKLLLLVLLILLAAPFLAAAQPPSDNNNNNNNSSNNSPYNNAVPNFNPSMAIVIVVIVSAFFFLGFFSIYIRQCGGAGTAGVGGAGGTGTAAIGRSRRGQRGLDPEVLETFPTVVYSEVKGLKIGKSALECAVCLNEFEDDETLRILPKCSHVFHPDCIGAWLDSHVTCPVCRANLSDPSNSGAAPFDLAAAGDESSPSSMTEERESIDRPMIQNPPPPIADSVAVDVDEIERKADLARIGSERRTARSKRFPAFPRSHSTGHSLGVAAGDQERFTLRLPEHIHKQIIGNAARLQRNTSSSAGGGGGAGGSSRRTGRSAWFGRSDRWPSFLGRTISRTHLPVWGSSRRADAEGSSAPARKGDAGEGSFKGRIQAVGRAPLECLGGGAAAGKEEDEEESSTVAFARV